LSMITATPIGLFWCEAAVHKLYAGDTTCKNHLKDTMDMESKKITQPVSVVCLDGGRLSAIYWITLPKRICRSFWGARYDWVMA